MLLFLCLLSSPLTNREPLHKSLFAFSWCYSLSAYSPRRLVTVDPSLDAILFLLTLFTAYWPWILLLMLFFLCLLFSPLIDRGFFSWCLLLLYLLSSPLPDRGSFSWCYSFSAYSPRRLLTVDPSLNSTLSLLTLLVAYGPRIIILMVLFLCLLASPLTDHGPLHKSLFAFPWFYSFSAYSACCLLTVDPYTKVFLPSLDATLSLLTLLAADWPWIHILMLTFLCLFSSPLTDRGHLHKNLFAFFWCYSLSVYTLRRLLTVDSLYKSLFCLLFMLLFLCLLCSPLTDRGYFSWCYPFSGYSPRRLLTVDPLHKSPLPSLDAFLPLLTLLAAYW